MNLQVDIDFEKEPIGTGKDGKSVFFKNIWPSNEEIAEVDTDPYYLLQSAIFICKTLSVGFYLYIEPSRLFFSPLDSNSCFVVYTPFILWFVS